MPGAGDLCCGTIGREELPLLDDQQTQVLKIFVNRIIFMVFAGGKAGV
jgi:hypothetical protein